MIRNRAVSASFRQYQISRDSQATGRDGRPGCFLPDLEAGTVATLSPAAKRAVLQEKLVPQPTSRKAGR